MMILVTYDVNTEDAGGKRRLRRVAKVCMDHGQRVQNSVFECVVDAAQSRELEAKLQVLIDPERDSLRLYYMGNNYETKVHHFGVRPSYAAEGMLMI